MKKEDVIYSRKEFLNLPGQESMANIVAHIIKDDEWYPKDSLKRMVDITLSFANCDRKIDMYLNIDTEYNRENALHKVDTLIDVLTDFRKSLKKEIINQEEIEEKIAKQKAKKDKK